MDAQEKARPVEVRVGGVEMGRAHRELPRVDPVAQDQPTTAQGQAPALFIELLERNRSCGINRRNGDDVPCKIPNHVAAGDPGGHGDEQLPGRRARNLERDREEMGLRALRPYAVDQIDLLAHAREKADLLTFVSVRRLENNID